MERVVITGIGAITPIGLTSKKYWKNLLQGTCGSDKITKFDTSKFKTQFACEIKDYDPLNYFEKKDIRKYDLFTQYALVAAEEAISNSKIDFDILNKNKIGVIWGSSNGGMQTFEEQLTDFIQGDGTPKFNPYFIPKYLVNMASGIISIKYGLKGVNFTTVTACAASNTAIIEAFNHIKWGKADMIIAGGSEAGITPANIGGFNSAKALSTLNDHPKSASRPFDVNRDGFVMGEGAGALIIESYSSAIKRNAPIIAEIVGGGMGADAYHLTGTHPEGEGAFLCMKEALEEAKLQPSDIDYINAHATSTFIGDASEMRAIERVFGTNPNAVISATKSMTGHLLGAAGAVEAVASVLAVQNDWVPPTMNTEKVDEEFEGKFDFVLGKAKAKTINYAMSNTFGFGGHIATCIFKKFEG